MKLRIRVPGGVDASAQASTVRVDLPRGATVLALQEQLRGCLPPALLPPAGCLLAFSLNKTNFFAGPPEAPLSAFGVCGGDLLHARVCPAEEAAAAPGAPGPEEPAPAQAAAAPAGAAASAAAGAAATAAAGGTAASEGPAMSHVSVGDGEGSSRTEEAAGLASAGTASSPEAKPEATVHGTMPASDSHHSPAAPEEQMLAQEAEGAHSGGPGSRAPGVLDTGMSIDRGGGHGRVTGEARERAEEAGGTLLSALDCALLEMGFLRGTPPNARGPAGAGTLASVHGDADTASAVDASSAVTPQPAAPPSLLRLCYGLPTSSPVARQVELGQGQGAALGAQLDGEGAGESPSAMELDSAEEHVAAGEHRGSLGNGKRCAVDSAVSGVPGVGFPACEVLLTPLGSSAMLVYGRCTLCSPATAAAKSEEPGAQRVQSKSATFRAVLPALQPWTQMPHAQHEAVKMLIKEKMGLPMGYHCFECAGLGQPPIPSLLTVPQEIIAQSLLPRLDARSLVGLGVACKDLWGTVEAAEPVWEALYFQEIPEEDRAGWETPHKAGDGDTSGGAQGSGVEEAGPELPLKKRQRGLWKACYAGGLGRKQAREATEAAQAEAAARVRRERLRWAGPPRIGPWPRSNPRIPRFGPPSILGGDYDRLPGSGFGFHGNHGFGGFGGWLA